MNRIIWPLLFVAFLAFFAVEVFRLVELSKTPVWYSEGGSGKKFKKCCGRV